MANKGCTYTNADGDSCGMAALKKGAGGCYIHDISVRADRLLARASAGEATKLSKAKKKERQESAHRQVLMMLAKSKFYDRVKALLEEALGHK